MRPPSCRRWTLFGVTLLLLVGGVAGGWRWFHAPATSRDPPLPADMRDSEVRQAIEQSRQNVLGAPRSADAWGNHGLTLMAHLFDREADVCFAEAARLAPTDARWPYARGLIALKRDPENAPPLLRQAASMAAESWPEHQSDLCLKLAEALLERHQLDEAEKVFREEWRRQPGNPRAPLGLGMIALSRDDQQAAADFLTAARTSRHASRTATAQLAALARRRGDQATANNYEEQHAALSEDLPWPDPILDELFRLQVGHRQRERQADKLERQHKYEEVAAVMLHQLQEEPTAEIHVAAGINLVRVGDYERGLPLLREGVRRDPDSTRAQYSLALALFSQAEEEWQRSPDSEQAKKGFREAIIYARRATELKSDHALAYLFWGLALKHLGESTAAVAPLRRGVACRPEMFELQLALGEALLESGQRREAETHLENARRLDPKDSRLIQALERLREKKN
jgi:tetratricopeptide (TPR) repeat protein